MRLQGFAFLFFELMILIGSGVFGVSAGRDQRVDEEGTPGIVDPVLQLLQQSDTGLAALRHTPQVEVGTSFFFNTFKADLFQASHRRPN
ncbi:MAG: hypothetical protein HQK59_17430 [Deltaproteobacteria bacterium]|nr:hypothetical protein [Deltaproteobacteria bacterium]